VHSSVHHGYLVSVQNYSLCNNQKSQDETSTSCSYWEWPEFPSGQCQVSITMHSDYAFRLFRKVSNNNFHASEIVIVWVVRYRLNLSIQQFVKKIMKIWFLLDFPAHWIRYRKWLRLEQQNSHVTKPWQKAGYTRVPTLQKNSVIYGHACMYIIHYPIYTTKYLLCLS